MKYRFYARYLRFMIQSLVTAHYIFNQCNILAFQYLNAVCILQLVTLDAEFLTNFRIQMIFY